MGANHATCPRWSQRPGTLNDRVHHGRPPWAKVSAISSRPASVRRNVRPRHHRRELLGSPSQLPPGSDRTWVMNPAPLRAVVFPGRVPLVVPRQGEHFGVECRRWLAADSYTARPSPAALRTPVPGSQTLPDRPGRRSRCRPPSAGSPQPGAFAGEFEQRGIRARAPIAAGSPAGHARVVNRYWADQMDSPRHGLAPPLAHGDVRVNVRSSGPTRR